MEERLLPRNIHPLYMGMCGAHVVVAGEAAAYVWQYKNQASVRGIIRCNSVRPEVEKQTVFYVVQPPAVLKKQDGGGRSGIVAMVFPFSGRL